MLPTSIEEQDLQQNVYLFDEINGEPLAERSGRVNLAAQLHATDRLDTLLAGLKWAFLFLPGATAIHCCVMILSMSPAMNVSPSDILFEVLVALLIYTFMVLFGLGRLGDIRYFKVIGAILSTSALIAVVYHILAAFFIGYASFGWMMLVTTPLPIIFAQLIKLRLDRGESV